MRRCTGIGCLNRRWLIADGALAGWLIVLAAVFCAATCCAAAGADDPGGETAAAGEAEGAEPAPIESAAQLLDALEARGRTLQSYKAKVVYTREQRLLGDQQTRIGRVAYLAPARADADDADGDRSGDAEAGNDEGDQTKDATKFAVFFNKLVVGRALRARKRYFIFDGKWLAEIDPQRKQFIRRQVVGPGESFDPLKLGEGPFPLPLGQEKRRVLDIFEAELVETDDAGGGLHHVRLTPRADRDAGRNGAAFDQVDIWYDRRTLLPHKVVTVEGDDEAEANVTTVKLTEAEVNTMDREQASGLFDTTPPKRGSGWHVEIKPLETE